MSVVKVDQLQPRVDAGIEALAQGDIQTGIELFHEVLVENNDFMLAHYYLATAYMRLQKWQEAEKYLDTVMDLAPSWPCGSYSAGQVASVQGFHDDAVAFFSAALKNGIDNRQGLIARGMALYGCGRLVDAIDDLDQVITQEMDLTALQYRMACFLGMHRYQEALSDIEALITLQGETEELLDIRQECQLKIPASSAAEPIRMIDLPG
ncbi:tetratricopeptide repeat protein [uncultured Endozoicomonas sp.]|uniref:tetratricopeptide repeat protein n=1 Tax=uncultured Endozoicomonas sp. TaxID=432652 RepID=UPI002639AF38|nr:tetratricopeptide repeat protein [uncultured Endozoicomonas sp.]